MSPRKRVLWNAATEILPVGTNFLPLIRAGGHFDRQNRQIFRRGGYPSGLFVQAD